MKTIYIDCSMGAAGDMLMSALLELHPNREDFIKKINGINIPDVNIRAEKSVKCGITGTHTEVSVKGISESEDMFTHTHKHEHSHNHEHNHEHEHKHSHHHSHRNMDKIENIINSLNVNENVKKNALEVYRLIAEAEGFVHGKKIEDIHFHEVGTMDAVADITGVCMLIDEIGAERIIASPVNTGSGQVKCAHGILPVPAPATAYVLRGIPIYSDGTKGELCTPTGAALLKHFVNEFSDMPVMNVENIGYGMGTKDFEKANCLRVFIGETENRENEITELNCNIDDMTAEEVSFACNRLRKEGALEVYTTAIGMKKNRQGVLLTCLCRNEDKEKLLETIFRYTSTIGIRECVYKRYVLDRYEKRVSTELGEVSIKYSTGYGISKSKAEYEDIAKIAEENNMSVEEVKKIVGKYM